MTYRSVKAIHIAQPAHMEDLVTFRALPLKDGRYLDPFLFLNHHGRQVYPPFNKGLPFGPHPHRGFETVTFILKGDVRHRDTAGNDSTIKEGGIQWMTAGRGLLHEEVSSEDFKEKGGELEILQLWVNLPSKLKMAEPAYSGYQENEILHLEKDSGRIRINLISGEFDGEKGPFKPLSGVNMATIEFQDNGTLNLNVDNKESILCYVVYGSLIINDKKVGKHSLLEFESDGNEIEFKAAEKSYIIFGHGIPFEEAIEAHGPFVMNTTTEIMQAFRDFQMGKMGVWID